MKKCSICQKSKDFSEFCFHKIQPDGYSSCCKKCSSLKKLIYYRTPKGLVYKIYQNQIQSSIRRKHNLPSYTRTELEDFIFSDFMFDKFYNDWVQSNYKKDLIPSIDRKDDYKPYTLDNIQLTIWKLNNKKGNHDRKYNINTKINKSVQQLSLDFVVIAEYGSTMEAQRATNIGNSEISKCCRNIKKYNTAGGFRWRYKNEYIK